MLIDFRPTAGRVAGSGFLERVRSRPAGSRGTLRALHGRRGQSLRDAAIECQPCSCCCRSRPRPASRPSTACAWSTACSRPTSGCRCQAAALGHQHQVLGGRLPAAPGAKGSRRCRRRWRQSGARRLPTPPRPARCLRPRVSCRCTASAVRAAPAASPTAPSPRWGGGADGVGHHLFLRAGRGHALRQATTRSAAPRPRTGTRRPRPRRRVARPCGGAACCASCADVGGLVRPMLMLRRFMVSVAEHHRHLARARGAGAFQPARVGHQRRPQRRPGCTWRQQFGRHRPSAARP